ncbi:MAG TPA: YbjN domain-containing protein [Allosphingosinicella sp.]|jgi:hypothetical protein
MNRAFKFAIPALAAAAFAMPAQAQMVTAANPDSVVKTLQDAGYTAKLAKDNTGDPMIESAATGSSFRVLFYGCTGGRNCATIQFTTGYDTDGKTSLAAANEWNSKQRFGRAFIDKDGDPILQMDVDLDDGGVSKLLFTDNLEFWIAVKQGFEKHIGWGQK